MMSKNKKAFSLAEMLIVLAIMGVVAGLTIPTLIRTSPDKDKMMFKKAYYTLEQTVANLINDPTLYGYDEDGVSSGFRDLSEQNGCSGTRKFACLFEKQLNTLGDFKCNGSFCTFTGTDGIYWYVRETNFSVEDPFRDWTVIMDVNGNKNENGKGPDCGEYSTGQGCKDNPDWFTFTLTHTGKIQIYAKNTTHNLQPKLVEYLKSTKSVK